MAQKKEKEVATLSAPIAYFVMNVAINGMLVVNGKITADGQIAKKAFWKGTVTSVCGIQSLQMGVFGGIIVGLGVAGDCITASIRSCFPMHFLSLAVPDSCRSFLPLYTCLWEF